MRARYLRTANEMSPDDYDEKMNRVCARERNRNEGGRERQEGTRSNRSSLDEKRRENGAKFNEQTAQMHR